MAIKIAGTTVIDDSRNLTACRFTTSVITAASTNAVVGNIYLVNATAGVRTIVLPTASLVVGDTIIVKDYKNNSETNNITVDPGVTYKIEAGSAGVDHIIANNGDCLTFVWDGVDTWAIVNQLYGKAIYA